MRDAVHARGAGSDHLGVKHILDPQLGEADDLVGEDIQAGGDRAARAALPALIAGEQRLTADFLYLA